jgi:hypothetical protein
MIVVEKNEGAKIEYKITVSTKKITFGDDELTINLSKYERDEEVCIDICVDENGMLTIGQMAKYYVAQVILPARQYSDEEHTNPVTFNINNATLILWALEADYNNG